MIPPNPYQAAYEQTRAAVLAGEAPIDPPPGQAGLSLSAWVTVKRLGETLGDVGPALRAHRVGLHTWARAERAYAELLGVPEVRARFDLLVERGDPAAEATRLRTQGARVSTQTLEPDAALVNTDGGPVIAGYVWDNGSAPRVRVVDLDGSVRWTAAPNTLAECTGPLARTSYRAHRDLLHVAHRDRLVGLDLATGQRRYGARLPEPIRDHQPGLFFGTTTRVMVATTTRITGIDTASGAHCWSHTLGGGYTAEAAMHGVVVLAHTPPSFAAALKDDGTLKRREAASTEKLAGVFGDDTCMWLRMHRQTASGWQSGLASLTGELLELPVNDGIRPAFVNGHSVWSAAAPGELAVISPAGAHTRVSIDPPELMPRQLLAAGEHVWLVAEHRMQGERHLCRLAPNLRSVAFDSGSLGPAPVGQALSAAASGAFAVVASGGAAVTLTAFENDRMLWSRAHDGWLEHFVCGEHVAVSTAGGISIHRLADGVVVWEDA